jgi:hypothetical protein
MKNPPLTNARRFQERYPHMWDAVQPALAEAAEPLTFTRVRQQGGIYVHIPAPSTSTGTVPTCGG